MAKLLFNPTLAKWMSMSEDQSTIFKGSHADYDDPTYLTFKIEFGDWGSSVLSRDALDSGTTLFNVKSMQYDQLPMGLMNCPAPGAQNSTNTYWLNASSQFVNTNTYSAFTYLRTRNEDVRALYIYGFVNGLYEIQKETPYLFKSISGLSNLDKIDTVAGQKIKGNSAKITITCLEGLSLKMRTLMEMYRKGAWDDAYQRWILPENMREFKMIIYVFERRTFHVGEAYNLNGSNRMKLKNDSINLDLPVKVFECFPCEFDITSGLWDDTYSAGAENTQVETKITVNVKNVRTYYKNGLLSNNPIAGFEFDKLLIYDLIDSYERVHSSSVSGQNTGQIVAANATVNQVKQLFMNKSVFLQNEDMHTDYAEYIEGVSSAGPFKKDGVSDDRIAAALKELNTAFEDTYAPTDDHISIYMQSQRSSWRSKTISMALMNILTLNVESLISGDSTKSKATSNGKVNTLNFTVTYKDKSLALKIAALIKGSKFDDTYLPSSVIEAALEKERSVDAEIELDLEKLRSVSGELNDGLEDPRDPADYQNTVLEPERKKPADHMDGLEDPRNIDPQNMQTLKDPRLIPDGEFAGLEKEREIDGDLLSDIQDARDIPAWDIRDSLEDERSLKGEIDNADMEARPLPDSDLTIDFDGTDRSTRHIEDILFAARKIDGLLNIKMEDVRSLPKEDIVKLEESIDKLKPVYSINSKLLFEAVDTVKTLPTDAFIQLEETLKLKESEAIALLKANTALQEISVNSGNTRTPLEDLVAATKEITDNSEKIKEHYIILLSKLKQQLKDATEMFIRQLPGPKDAEIESIDRNYDGSINVSFQDLQQIAANLPLLGLEENDFKKMSLQNILQLNIDIENQIKSTKDLSGLSKEFAPRQTAQDTLQKTDLEAKKKSNKKQRVGISTQIEAPRQKPTTFETF